MSEDQFEYEVTRGKWYEEQDKDEKWIAEQEAITEANKLGVNNDILNHLGQVSKELLGEDIFGGK